MKTSEMCFLLGHAYILGALFMDDLFSKFGMIFMATIFMLEHRILRREIYGKRKTKK